MSDQDYTARLQQAESNLSLAEIRLRDGKPGLGLAMLQLAIMEIDATRDEVNKAIRRCDEQGVDVPAVLESSASAAIRLNVRAENILVTLGERYDVDARLLQADNSIEWGKLRHRLSATLQTPIIPATGQDNGAKRKAVRRKPGDLNGAMLNMIMQRPESRGWTARRWGKELHANHSQVAEQPTWKELEQARELQRIERQRAKRKGRVAN